jgi:molybdopterin synthase sulfur carrier subunit
MARVVLLGRLRDIAGWRERTVDASSVWSLRTTLAAEDPALGDALAGPAIQVALNKTLTRDDAALGPIDEVAFLPPMSGG